MINLYSDPRCSFSHRARILLATKELDYNIIDLNLNNIQDIVILSPRGITPILVDDIDKNNRKKDLKLTDINVICEYIEDRFPYPLMLPSEPSERARMKMQILTYERDIFALQNLMEKHLTGHAVKTKKEVKELKDKLTVAINEIAEKFIIDKKLKYLGNTENLSLLDVTVLPLLWRLNYYEIPVNPQWKLMIEWSKKIFATKQFQKSLSVFEKSIDPKF